MFEKYNLHLIYIRHKTIGLCKKLNSIYTVFYVWSTALSNRPERIYSSLHVMRLLTLRTQTDRFLSLDLNVSSRAAGFNLVLSVNVFLSLKAVGPIDCHYMTDRLQRFELKTLICVLLKKQSHRHLGYTGGKQINIKCVFLGELYL